MNLNALLKFMMLHMMNQNAPVDINHSPEIEIVNLSPMIEKTNNDLDNPNSNEEYRRARLFPKYDCSMPIPPHYQPRIKNNGIDASTQTSNMEEETKEISIKENINPQKINQPRNLNGEALNRLERKSKQELIGNVEKFKNAEDEIIAKPRAKASMEIPLHIVHRIPDAVTLDLMR